MGISEITGKFLGLATKKDFEQLQTEKEKEVNELKDVIATQELLLKDFDAQNPATFTSSIARETHKKEDVQGTVVKRVPVKELQLLYLNNQFIFRGVNVRADELITRGYRIVEGDENGRNLCQELITNSGEDNLFWQLSVNTDVAGDGYLEKVKNQAGTKIALLKHVNPINFGFMTDLENDNQILVDDAGKPTSYLQRVVDKEGKEQRIEVSLDEIAHLRFNTFGDEFNGISSLQPVYNTSIRLMNMEHAAAEAAVKTANPTWVVTTETKSPQELAKWAGVLGRISAKEVVFLPNGVKLELKSPGNQNFSDYSNYFLDAVVAALGVPKSILTGSSDTGGGNRATVQTLSKHFFSVIRANQRYVTELFNKIFEEYGDLAGFKPPKLVFNDIAEDADRNGQRAVELFQNKIITLKEAREAIGLEMPKGIEQELSNNPTTDSSSSKIDPKKEEKRQDMKTFHPANEFSPEGSQKGNKRKQKPDSDIPSVR